MTTIFIMAQGQQTRMGAAVSVPKQLLEVNGEPIVSRTIRLLGARPFFVVAETNDHWRALDHPTPILTLPNPGKHLVNGIMACKQFWTDDTLFLLGDVIYSRATFDRILLEKTRSLLVWGRTTPNFVTKRGWPEMYALRFGPGGAHRITEQAAACQNLHDVCVKIAWKDEFREVSDFTDDIDWPKDLETLPALSEAVRQEEL
ncbi:MAG: NTP transferase domain-containing protein [Thermoplasmata archaeon]